MIDYIHMNYNIVFYNKNMMKHAKIYNMKSKSKKNFVLVSKNNQLNINYCFNSYKKKIIKKIKLIYNQIIKQYNKYLKVQNKYNNIKEIMLIILFNKKQKYNVIKRKILSNNNKIQIINDNIHFLLKSFNSFINYLNVVPNYFYLVSFINDVNVYNKVSYLHFNQDLKSV